MHVGMPLPRDHAHPPRTMQPSPDHAPSPETATAADSTHPTGMHSCLTTLTFHFSLLNDQMEKFRKECSELKVQNAKLASQVSDSSI